MRNKITRTREQQAADRADYAIYHLAVKAEMHPGEAWQKLAAGLHALRPIIRAQMHPIDVENTKG